LPTPPKDMRSRFDPWTEHYSPFQLGSLNN
jgi:hypothetical protein